MQNKNDLNKKLFIYGCGGHGRSVADVAIYNGYKQIKFIDPNARKDETSLGIPIINNFSDDGDYIIALGNNLNRASVYNNLHNKAKKFITIVSTNAYQGQNVKIGLGTFIGHNAYIGPNVIIGNNTIINTSAIVEHDCQVGNNVHIAINATLAGRCRIGDLTMIGASVTIINGISICSNAIIGAGSVVIKDISEPGTYVGIPARKI